jgi:ATP-dependent protease ClpP protease subunit
MSTNMNNLSNIDTILQNIHQYHIDTKNREIFLHSPLDWEEEGGVDYRSAIYLEKNIRHLNLISNDPILIHMHLPGGDWQDCLGMYDTIQSSKSKIIILAYAKVESASSVLFQAAHCRILMPNTHILIHYGSLSIENEHKAAIASLQWSEKESEKMIEIFTERCLCSPIAQEKNWKKFIVKKHIMSQLANKSDWILNANEAIDYGFADGVLGSKQFPDIDSLKSKAFSKKKIKI